ncbi:dimethylmenaquinone methyltransferase [Pseudonocardia sulfidoxydans NBRC 16205]|uniref:Putative 4-hydroxy-4-methyl-2-oxoglutarate aldolase n=1 Tax=Pseudonocardia sulfidoxydans NBRC 16205 TaxID=1223511 RepID=A0A511DMT8_9PSEU|nr:RraA family protein [Pseudonocardia sulfidoxydans]GEL25583.1 dimethylmenaquinone methyltransferase [Pseudonocardia sulfidoxydans NBRC 16205]
MTDLPALLDRLRTLQVSSVCDADKTLGAVDPAIHTLVPGTRLAGPATTVVAHDDHLGLLVAIREAPAGSVLVVATEGGRRAVSGELFATEAKRCGLAGIVVDGYCRDRAGIAEVGLPVYARGSTPMAGTTVNPGRHGEAVQIGGVTVSPGDLVVGDDDGLVVGTVDQFAAAVPGAEEVERAEAALLAGMAEGRDLPGMTTLVEHLAALADGKRSALRFTP